jgi:hypothetical protein
MLTLHFLAFHCHPQNLKVIMNVIARSVQRTIPLVQRTVMARSTLRLFSTRYTESHEYIKVCFTFSPISLALVPKTVMGLYANCYGIYYNRWTGISEW